MGEPWQANNQDGIPLLAFRDASTPRSAGFMQQKRPKPFDLDLQLGYKDSNLEMTESESVALPFGDSPISATDLIIVQAAVKSKHFF